MSRFGDTAANTGMLTLMNNHPALVDLPVQVKTIGASAAAASVRVCLMPIDALKTTLQVEGSGGLALLRAKGNKKYLNFQVGVNLSSFVIF